MLLRPIFNLMFNSFELAHEAKHTCSSLTILPCFRNNRVNILVFTLESLESKRKSLGSCLMKMTGNNNGTMIITSKAAMNLISIRIDVGPVISYYGSV